MFTKAGVIAQTHKSNNIPLLLDTYTGALAAYSLRQLRTGQLNCIRVYRNNDGAEQNIGFVNGVVDTAALLSFVGANIGTLTTWYDQSGNGNDATQTGGFGPIVINATVVTTVNGKAALDMYDQSVPGSVQLPTGILNGSTNLSYFQVAKVKDFGASNAGVFAPSTTNSTGLEILQHTVISRRSLLRINSTIRNDNSGAAYQLWDDDTQSLTTVLGNSSSVAAYKNSAAVTLTDSSAMPALNFNGVYAIGYYNSSVSNMNGYFQELIIYSTDQTVNRVAIETDINTYYTIF